MRPLLLILPAVFLAGVFDSWSQSPPRPPGVPADAEHFGGRWFRIYHEDVSWEAAQKKCHKLGGRLAVVPDRATWDFLAQRVGRDHVWLGARDEHREGKWRWVDGSPMRFTAWGKNQPNRGHTRQDYVYTGRSGWKDSAEDGRIAGKLFVHGFICEWPEKK